LSADERTRLETKLQDIRSDPGPKRLQQILLREDVSRDMVATLETHAAELKGVDVAPVPVRYYPQGELGAHALGYMAQIDSETLVGRFWKPTYGPNQLSGGEGVDVIRNTFKRLNVDPLQPMLDKTMSGAYPPGSTFKPFSALAALEDRIVDPREKVRCDGYY